MSKCFGETSKNKIFALLCIFICLLFASCGGGGGGGGGAVSYAPDSNTHHNGGDAGGWGTGNQTGGGMGGTSIEEANATLLLGQSAALSYQKVDIDLVVNGVHYAINNVTATTTTEVLPKIPIGAEVSGTATIFLDNGTTRVAELEMTSIGIHNNLIFKVPYNYECIDKGTTVASGTYFSRDGIDISAYTGVRVAGWLCSDGTMHYGGYITGVRGDITLTAVYKVAVTSDVPEISRPSSLITTLGISADSGGTALKPETAQLSVFGSSNYTYSCDATKVTVDASGAVSLASGYPPPLAGETVTITVTDNDDPTLYATVDLTISSQCVLAMYKDKASHDAETSPDYTKIIGGSDGTTASGNLYALAGALIEANKSALTQNTEQISDWKRTTPMPMKVTKTSSIPISDDTKVYALYEMAVSIDNGLATGKDKISKHSTLLAQLVSQSKIAVGAADSLGTLVYPTSAQLTVTGSDGYSFSSSPSGKVDINNSTGKVTVAGSYTPSAPFESVTVRATDNNDSSIYAECTVQICNQKLLAVYKDKAACDNNSAPDYKILLGGYAGASFDGSIGFCPYSQCASTIQALKPGKTISAWKQASPSTTAVIKNETGAPGTVSVVGDTKIYAGWPIDGISASEIVLWRFTDTASDRQGTLARPVGNYSASWVQTGYPVSPSLNANGTDVDFSVLNSADLSAFEDAANPGVYHGTYRVALVSDPASFTDVPVTVKDAMYVNASGELAFRAGKTLPADLTITSPLNGKSFNSIASNAFKNLTYITSLTISGIDGRICGNAFNGCSSLQSVTITGSGNLGIDGGAFSNCPSLSTITINNVGYIAMNSFVGTTASSITITSTTMTKINGFSHAYCGAITIPKSVTTIGSSEFAGTRFQRVNIPTSVTRFESYAFQQTSGDIYYAGTQAEWNAITKDTGNSISSSRLHFNATW